jgi:hypothetical protein
MLGMVEHAKMIAQRPLSPFINHRCVPPGQQIDCALATLTRLTMKYFIPPLRE